VNSRWHDESPSGSCWTSRLLTSRARMLILQMRARSVSCKCGGWFWRIRLCRSPKPGKRRTKCVAGRQDHAAFFGYATQVPHWLESAVPPRGLVFQKTRDDCHHGVMQTVFEAAGGMDGLRRLADAWHRRVTADGVVGQCVQPRLPPPACRASTKA